MIGATSCASSICNVTAGAPGVCAPALSCGNGVREAGEGCDDGNAIESARDLTMLYAGTRYAALARDYLETLPDALKKHDAEKEAKADAGN